MKDKQTCNKLPLVRKWPTVLTWQAAGDRIHPGMLVIYHRAGDPTASLAKEQLVLSALLSLNKTQNQ